MTRHNASVNGPYEVKRGKNYEKNRKRREKKRVMRDLAGMTLADLDPESSDNSSGQTKRARESLDSLSSQQPPAEAWAA